MYILLLFVIYNGHYKIAGIMLQINIIEFYLTNERRLAKHEMSRNIIWNASKLV